MAGGTRGAKCKPTARSRLQSSRSQTRCGARVRSQTGQMPTVVCRGVLSAAPPGRPLSPHALAHSGVTGAWARGREAARCAGCASSSTSFGSSAPPSAASPPATAVAARRRSRLRALRHRGSEPAGGRTRMAHPGRAAARPPTRQASDHCAVARRERRARRVCKCGTLATPSCPVRTQMLASGAGGC